MTAVVIGEPAWPISRSDDTSRGRAFCSAARAASIVGTGMYTVTPCCSIASRHAPASNPGRTTSEPPNQMTDSTGAVPATWKNGPDARNTSSSRSPQAIVLWNEFATRLRWVSWTPLGRPVVPPVKYRTARSSSVTPAPRANSAGAASTIASHSANVRTRSTSSERAPGSRSVTSTRWSSAADDPFQLGRRKADVQRHEDQAGGRARRSRARRSGGSWRRAPPPDRRARDRGRRGRRRPARSGRRTWRGRRPGRRTPGPGGGPPSLASGPTHRT